MVLLLLKIKVYNLHYWRVPNIILQLASGWNRHVIRLWTTTRSPYVLLRVYFSPSVRQHIWGSWEMCMLTALVFDFSWLCTRLISTHGVIKSVYTHWASGWVTWWCGQVIHIIIWVIFCMGFEKEFIKRHPLKLHSMKIWTA